MSALIEISIPNNKGEYKPWTINVSDTSSPYGTNVTMHKKQTEEERKSKKKPNKIYYGKVFWTNGVINLAVKKDESKPSASNEEPFGDPKKLDDTPWNNEESDEDDLPF